MAVELAQHRSAAAAEPDASGTRGLWADEFRRVAVLEKSRHLRGLLGFRKQAERDAAETNRRAVTLSESRKRVQAERESRRRADEAKKAALEQTQERVAEAARKAKELEESAKALTSLLDRLGKAASFRRPGTPARLDLPRHSLPWPVAGKVLRGFGRERDPELGTWTVRQASEIAAAAAAPVPAVAAGKVIFAGPFRSYGKVLILDHGAGFFSVYGELGELLKTKGAAARSGEPIARAGAAKDGAGRLYLELRRGTEALDPQAWLEKRPDGGS
jgi:septal ring factor EnvC (AmiA/AmiB activator)